MKPKLLLLYIVEYCYNISTDHNKMNPKPLLLYLLNIEIILVLITIK